MNEHPAAMKSALYWHNCFEREREAAKLLAVDADRYKKRMTNLASRNALLHHLLTPEQKLDYQRLSEKREL